MNVRTLRLTRPVVATLAAALLAPAALVACSGGDDSAGSSGKAKIQSAQTPSAEAGVQVELMLNAGRADWQPEADGHGTLVLEDVDPRLVMMAVAPRRESVVVPVSQLVANWERLFGANGNETNILLAVDAEERRQLVPLRASLVDGHDSGRTVTLAVSPLEGGAHELDSLGDAAATFESVSVVVDPEITDAIKAMWDALVAFFADKSYELPPNPTFDTNGTISYWDGFDPMTEHAATYKGPTGGDITDPADRDRIQHEITDAVGNVGERAMNNGGRGWNLFPGSTYDGIALFDEHAGVFVDGDAELGRTVMTNSAIYGMSLDALEFRNADVGGLNLRGTAALNVTVENSAFDQVDMTGASLGPLDIDSPDQRSSVTNSVFENVSVNEKTRLSIDDNRADKYEGEVAKFRQVDFTSVSFRNVDLSGSEIEKTTFQGCGLFDVNLSRTNIEGTPTDAGGQFEPTFENSILENVKLDGAELSNVSFRGTYFGDGVSLDGAVLRDVDFTGATGLQNVDWTKVTIDGPVYGLEPVGNMLDLGDHPEYFRFGTFDGVVGAVDPDTGYDIDPRDGVLVDPGTGVRFSRDTFSGELIPWDPVENRPATALNGDPLVFDGGRLVDPNDPDATFDVDYFSGEIRYK
jgi:uncharacterized protein YjbI with pentapeptide repeats